MLDLNEEIKKQDKLWQDYLDQRNLVNDLKIKDIKDEYLYTSYSLYADKKEGFTQSQASDTLKYLKKLYKYTRPVSTLYRLLTVK